LTCSEVCGYRNYATFDVCVTINNHEYLSRLGRLLAQKAEDIPTFEMAWKTFALMYDSQFAYDLVAKMNNNDVDWVEVYQEMLAR
jgi:hypothetical protein